MPRELEQVERFASQGMCFGSVLQEHDGNARFSQRHLGNDVLKCVWQVPPSNPEWVVVESEIEAKLIVQPPKARPGQTLNRRFVFF